MKWALFAVVLAYVGRHAYLLWIRNDARTALSAASVGWLTGSALLYLLAWLPSVWFWNALMRALGGRVSFLDAARAYYCGHLGKYVPGKAMVLVIRAALVKDRGCPPRIAATTAAYETLTMMGTGLAVAAGLAPLLFPAWLRRQTGNSADAWVASSGITIAVVVIVVLLSLPGIAKLLSWIVARTTPQAEAGTTPLVIPARLLAGGCLAFVLSWGVQGLSLGMTLRAVAGEQSLSHWPIWTGAMAASTSLGFAVLFAPAGIGVREGILLGILTAQPGIDPHAAIAATVLSRAVSFLSEAAVSAVLWTTRGRISSRNPAR